MSTIRKTISHYSELIVLSVVIAGLYFMAIAIGCSWAVRL